jgi:hypothetical protein
MTILTAVDLLPPITSDTARLLNGNFLLVPEENRIKIVKQMTNWTAVEF